MLRRVRLAVIKQIRKWDRDPPLTKRQLFVLITFILTAVLTATQLVSLDYRYPMITVLAVLTFGLCAFGLREDLKSHEWFTLLALPTMFTAAIALFYFLLPTRWLTRVPVAVLYAIGMYALLLTENIYNVAAVRTIALLRAAHSVGFLLTLTTYFLLSQTVLAYRFSGWMNALLIGLVTYLLTAQLLWSMNLEPMIGRRVRELSLIITATLMELTWMLSFLPVRSTIFALFLTTVFYGLSGLGQQYLADRLYKRTIWEFFGVVVIVGVIFLLTLNWRPGM